MPAGYSVRVYKKKYKKVLKKIADKIPAAFADKADRKRWISQMTNLAMQDELKRRTRKDAGYYHNPS